ncbi:FAD-binding domain-containing protein [Cyanobium sp. CH-040]|uniref:FAD-binding domain-containing protein n=1 Tax=Cyanobium sp. CH-040 TaxID=2823708 RepID=UPI0037BFBF6B
MGRPGSWPGGRREAERRLAALDPQAYGATRNHLDGAVTRLSPYIRHGVLTLAEVREAVFQWLRERGYAEPERRSEAQRLAGKLINELGWRDYWQRLWRQLGDGIWHDLEPLRTGHPAETYAPELPPDIGEGRTGLVCIDAFAAELMATGWLHNHARMWLASYVVHWRRVRWQAGAAWFLQHLLDGDPASNNLSWQWLASSFSSKPYIFNRANLERFSGGRFCAGCHLAGDGCPFEASYEVLQARLFRTGETQDSPRSAGEPAPEPAPEPATQPAAAAAVKATRIVPPVAPAAPLAPASGPPRRPLVWVHGEALGPANPALEAHPGAPALFVFDAELIAGRTATTGGQPLAPGRQRFLRDCVAELPVTVREGDVAAELLAAAAAAGADGIVTSRAVDPRFTAIARRLAAALPLQVLEPEPFVALPLEGAGAPDLGRFSRYWRRAEPLVWAGFSPAGPG